MRLTFATTATAPADEAHTYAERLVEGLRAGGDEVRRVTVEDLELALAGDAVEHVLLGASALAGAGELVSRVRRRVKVAAVVNDLAAGGALRLPGRLIVPSLHTAMALGPLGVLPDQLGVVLPAADKAPLARGSGAGVLLCVAPLSEAHGQVALVEALAALPAPWSLTLAGEGDSTPVRERAAALGVGERVHALGRLGPAELKAAYDRADLVVSAAREDSLALALLEALARGVPVLATVAGARPYVLPKGSAVLVSAETLPSALAQVLSQPPLLAAARRAAEQARAELRSWTRAASELRRELELTR